MKDIQQVTIIGSGNVATHLALALHAAGFTICQIFSRSINKANLLAKKIGAKAISDLANLSETELYIFAVTDLAIAKLASHNFFRAKFVVHTAGSVPMSVFAQSAEKYGVLYPLQTFSREVAVSFSEIPVCIEANSEIALNQLSNLAYRLSNHVCIISTNQRKTLHLAAVLACNFTNHLYTLSEEILSNNNISFDILHPLIRQTTQKAISHSPRKIQTGPAIRHDKATIDFHLKMLSNSSNIKKIYSFVSDSIINYYNDDKPHNMSKIKEEMTNIKAFVFDVDGVFTNSFAYLHPSGDLMRSMNTKDGYAVRCAVDTGYPVAIISGGKSESVRNRFQGLGVTDIYLGTSDKVEDFEDFMCKYSLKPDEILYMGDDMPDYLVMKQVGFPTCPTDAVEEIKSISKYISPYDGGCGCVRDVIEQVMRVQDNWGQEILNLKNQNQ